jgi:hypothetical protein
MNLPFDKDGLVSTLKKMAHSFRASVYSLSEDTIQKMHSLRQSPLGGFQQKVIVIAHEHEGMNEPCRPFDNACENVNELTPIGIVSEYTRSGIAAAGNVPDGTLMIEPQRTCHP